MSRNPEAAPLPVAIIAGGLATRLRPLTETIPKSMVAINGVPFIAHQLELLRARGIERVVLCVGHLSEMIRDFVSDGSRFGLNVTYSPDGPALLGTGGAIRQALPLLGEHFFTLYGDSFLPCDYSAVQSAFTRSGKLGLMTVFLNEGRFDSSNVEFGAGDVIEYNKRVATPNMRHIDYGLGVFHRSVFDSLPPGPCDLADVYRRLLAVRQLAAFELTERFYEIGSLEGIQSLSELLSKETVNR